MAVKMTRDVAGALRSLFEAGSMVGLSDAELIDRFLDDRGPVSSTAFSGLVDRHGPMVLRVCRSVLKDDHEAHDAFQLVFLTLARRAGSIRVRGSAGPWLHGVALRVSAKAKGRLVRRRRAEARRLDRQGVADSYEVDARPVDDWPELHEEVARLPSKYRDPVVLCYFEGRTHDEAAALLGWPVGTVRGRLSRARDRLRARLIRRGLAPAIGALSVPSLGRSACTLAGTIRPIPPSLLRATLAAAAHGSARSRSAAGAVSAGVSMLEGALRVILHHPIQAVGLAMTGTTVLTLGVTPFGSNRSYLEDSAAAVAPPVASMLRPQDPDGPGAREAAPEPDPPGDILSRWERRCREANSVLFTCTIVNELAVVGEREVSSGQFFSDFDGIAAVRIVPEGALAPDQGRRLVWRDGVGHEFDSLTRRHIIYPAASSGGEPTWSGVLREAIARQLRPRPWDRQSTALGLAFRFDREEASDSFRIESLPDLDGRARVALYPIGAEARESNSAVIVMLDRETGWPASIHRLLPNGKDKETITISRIETNVSPPAELVDVTTPEGWRVVQQAEFLRLPTRRLAH
jgi:RNA polymerase sigma factor (sigma-70 family)